MSIKHDIEEQALPSVQPSTPAVGYKKIYPKTDGLYELGSDGIEKKIGENVASDFDIKDLADITNLRTEWSNKQDTLPFVPGGTYFLREDGTFQPIPIVDGSKWKNVMSPIYIDYGYMYNGYAVKTGKLGPTGYPVATDAEWNILLNYLNGGDNNLEILRSTRTDVGSNYPYWHDGILSNNGVNFSLLPCGLRVGSNGFYYIGDYSFIFTATDYGPNMQGHFQVDKMSATGWLSNQQMANLDGSFTVEELTKFEFTPLDTLVGFVSGDYATPPTDFVQAITVINNSVGPIIIDSDFTI